MGALSQNVRYGLRMLAKNPGFTAAAVACLALGIGATTAIFSVVNAVLLRALPYANAARLVRVFTEFPNFPNGGLHHFAVSPVELLEIRRDTTSFEALEAWANNGVNLSGAAEPVRAQASYVTGGMMAMLGVTPEKGRLLTPADDGPNEPLTAMLSYNLWQRAYGGDPGILGRDIRLNGNPCTVIGVMPRGFAFPPGELDAPELWLPLQIDPANPGGRGSHYLSVLGRLRSGVNIPQASAEMVRFAQHSLETLGPRNHPFDPKNHPIVLNGFQDEVVANVRKAMLVLLGAVVCVLLIACVNVANLLLARSEARRREIAVRAAIGAGMGRLLQQFVVEGILLSLGGAALGMVLAFGGLRLLVVSNAGSIPRAGEINIDWQVLLFTLAVSVGTGIAFGLAPILHMKPSALYDTLKAAAGRTTSAVAANRFRAVLVTSELALALILLICSGLMVKAFWKLQEVHAGFDAERVLTMRLALPTTAYRDNPAVAGFYQALEDRVNTLPGVVTASVASGLPPVRPILANDTMIEGFVPVPNGPIQNVDYWNWIGPHYFDAIGAHLLEGRFLSPADGASAPLTVVVNQTMAKTFWPHQSAVGHRVKAGGSNGPWRTIVGVVADMKNAGLDRPAGTEMFIPLAQYPIRTAYLVLRTKSDPLSMMGAIRAQIRDLDRALPVSQVRDMTEVMASARSRPRFLTMLLTLFSSVSLVLAALGIYGVISFSVAQRTNEIGVRMALGARSFDVVRLVGVAGIRLALAGTAIGALGAFAFTRALSGLLFGVSSVDPVTFVAMAAMLIAVTLAACYIPARRASKVDPLIALRYE